MEFHASVYYQRLIWLVVWLVMSSSSESEDEKDNNNNKRNAFAGLNLYSDSESDSDSSEDDNVTKETVAPVTTAVAVDHRPPSDDSEEDSFSSSEENDTDDEGAAKDEISEFDHLAGRSTRHGTILQPDFVEAIKQVVVGGGDSTTTTSRPTEIQRECWTTMLCSVTTSDRDVIAISKTGSGKTLAFLVPLLGGLASPSKSLKGDDGFIHPRAIILAPTRVLAQQIYQVASTLIQNSPSLSNVKVSVALGGSAYHQQMTDLLATDPDLIIATPGRLNSLCGHVVATADGNMSNTVTTQGDDDDDSEVAMCIKLDNVCELVIDEADMMLALGFQTALHWFAQRVNHDSARGFRLVLTSATWEKETSANLSRFESMSEHDPVFLTTTTEGAGGVTKNVTQRVDVLAHKGAPRFNHLVKLLTAALQQDDDDTTSSRIIVFCLHKSQARQLGKDLMMKSKAAAIANVVLEGDMSQSARVAAIEAFRHGTQGRRVLVATDVAARGLDVLSVSHVFNYSLGISIESYIHRCGRTGRAGRFGVAHTFVVKGLDEKLSPELCGVLHKANQKIPDDLRIMAAKELKKRNKGPSAQPKDAEAKADAEELRELREANREKQRLHSQKHQRGSKKNAKRGGRGRK